MENFREPKLEIKVDASYVSLYPRDILQEGYHIHRKQCSTPEKILGWISHLSKKRWMDAEGIALFAQKAFGSIGIMVDYNL